MKRLTLLLVLALAFGCDPAPVTVSFETEESLLSLSEVAKIMSKLPLENEHLMEVYSAVENSSSNGYDEEYMMKDLFLSPGKGVGKDVNTKAASYLRPIRDLFSEYFQSEFETKAGGGAAEAARYLNSLESSDIQIYWPYSEEWDGETYPIITFDPGYGAEENWGYELTFDENGYRVVDSVLVNEEVAMRRPVWVINSNDDSSFTPLTIDTSVTVDDWGDEEEVNPASKASEDSDSKALSIQYFKALRSYDSWFGGASEFFIKSGAINGLKAKTDEELKQYYPSVTDMMIVVKRNQIGKKIPIRSLLLSEYTSQMDEIAFIIIEDDGGVTTSWKCSILVKIKSKSTGFEVDIPYKDKDDIVWRGTLSRSFFGDKKEVTQRFGDVEVTFGLK